MERSLAYVKKLCFEWAKGLVGLRFRLASHVGFEGKVFRVILELSLILKCLDEHG